MYVVDGIAYAGDPTPMIKVKTVRALPNFMLRLTFNDGKETLFDFKPLLDKPAFQPLKDQAVFAQAYVDYGTVVWNDGMIDIAPEYLYENQVCISVDFDRGLANKLRR